MHAIGLLAHVLDLLLECGILALDHLHGRLDLSSDIVKDICLLLRVHFDVLVMLVEVSLRSLVQLRVDILQITILILQIIIQLLEYRLDVIQLFLLIVKSLMVMQWSGDLTVVIKVRVHLLQESWLE